MLAVVAWWGVVARGEVPAGAPAVVANGPTLLAGALHFELDVMPVLTAAGCNAGACHGKSRGQNGFQLSLLGFDPDFDYYVGPSRKGSTTSKLV